MSSLAPSSLVSILVRIIRNNDKGHDFTPILKDKNFVRLLKDSSMLEKLDDRCNFHRLCYVLHNNYHEEEDIINYLTDLKVYHNMNKSVDFSFEQIYRSLVGSIDSYLQIFAEVLFRNGTELHNFKKLIHNLKPLVKSQGDIFSGGSTEEEEDEGEEDEDETKHDFHYLCYVLFRNFTQENEKEICKILGVYLSRISLPDSNWVLGGRTNMGFSVSAVGTDCPCGEKCSDGQKLSAMEDVCRNRKFSCILGFEKGTESNTDESCIVVTCDRGDLRGDIVFEVTYDSLIFHDQGGKDDRKEKEFELRFLSGGVEHSVTFEFEYMPHFQFYSDYVHKLSIFRSPDGSHKSLYQLDEKYFKYVPRRYSPKAESESSGFLDILGKIAWGAIERVIPFVRECIPGDTEVFDLLGKNVNEWKVGEKEQWLSLLLRKDTNDDYISFYFEDEQPGTKKIPSDDNDKSQKFSHFLETDDFNVEELYKSLCRIQRSGGGENTDSLQDVEREMLEYEFEGKHDHPMLLILREECELLLSDGEGGVFNVPFHNVLLRRITKKVKERGKRKDLLFIRKGLFHKHRYFWDRMYCKYHILSLFLFKEELYEIIEKCEKRIKGLWKQMGEDDNYESYFREKDELTLSRFESELEEINREYGCESLFEHVSYLIHLMNERVQLIREIASLKIDEDKLEEEEDIEDERKTCKVEIKKIKRDMRSNKGEPEKIVELKKKLLNQKKKLEKYEKKKLELEAQGKRQKKKLEKKERELRVVEENIKAMNPRASKLKNRVRIGEIQFLSSKKRYGKIKEMIDVQMKKMQMLEKRKTHGEVDEVVEVSVKLEMSIITEEPKISNPKFVKKKEGGRDTVSEPGVIDRARNKFLGWFGLYKYGYSHTSVNLANMGVDWSCNSIVYFSNHRKENPYREFIALDTGCVLFFKPSSLHDLAEMISSYSIYHNTMKTYKNDALKVTEGSMNCHEFSTELLKHMGHHNHHFFDEVKNYIEEMKKILSASKGHTPGLLGRLRFVKFSWVDGLKEMLVGGDEKWEEFDAVHFKTHKDLIVFEREVSSLLDSELYVEFPGLYALLKGFDRAFCIDFLKRGGKDSSWSINSKFLRKEEVEAIKLSMVNESTEM